MISSQYPYSFKPVQEAAVLASGGRGRDGRGRGRCNERKSYANNVDITDPHRNFTPDEWERLGSMRSYVLQLQDGGRGDRGRSDHSYQSYQGSNANRTTSGVSATNTNPYDSANTTNAPADQSVVSEISERGSQNGRGFGRGAYNT